MNIYNRLIGMLPSNRTDVGEVIQVYSDGVLVLLQTGGYLRVMGQATVGSKVFVKNGAVVGPAPSLAGVTVDI